MTHAALRPDAAPDARLDVESLDIDAQGIAHRPDGKVVFIEGALPFEQVSVVTTRSKPSFEKAVVRLVHRASSQRVLPRCPHFGLHEGACGGCKLQHMDAAAQVAAKQRVLEDSLWHLGKVRPERVLRPIQGPSWGYRYRARLSVRYVRKKDAVLVGFHERKSSFVADMAECHVLPRFVSDLLAPLRTMMMAMLARETCPQIELAVGDDGGVTVVALVLRHLAPLVAQDLDRLRDFAARHSSATERRHIQWWLQAQGPDSIRQLDDDGLQLAYALPEFGLRMPFRPTDFTQVNPHINQVLVGVALRLLAVRRDERVIDWFCGLGNFTLPLATLAGAVTGIEGSRLLTARARDNAAAAGLASATRVGSVAPDFQVRNLFEMDAVALGADGTAHKWLLDPPREGAFALVKALADLRQAQAARNVLDAPGDAVPVAVANAPVVQPTGWEPPVRIVYVSCNPATLARDAGLLVHQAGYRCTAAGIVNMFPHTAHVESIAVFERVDAWAPGGPV